MIANMEKVCNPAKPLYYKVLIDIESALQKHNICRHYSALAL